jgi:hypothetical protein
VREAQRDPVARSATMQVGKPYANQMFKEIAFLG